MLKSKLIDLIRLRGPITVSNYMKIVLTDPNSGFYTNSDVFGVKGHFTTSPEVSQIFGEIWGAWILQEWRRFNCPKPLRLVEFGPGRGTLMTDITRTLSKFQLTGENLDIRMIEVSPFLKEVQKKKMEQRPDILKVTKWHDHIDNLDDYDRGFTAFIQHEFLDALPIHKFVRDPKSNAWRELLIDYDQNENLRFCISRQPSLSCQLLIPEGFEGDHLEVCPDAALNLEKITSIINKTKAGCALICDYGLEHHDDKKVQSNITMVRPIRSDRDTFRAFKNHEPWPPLSEPGEADLTADVDFDYLTKHIHEKATVFGPVNQRDFLNRCGFQARLCVLLENANESEREDLLSGADMIINSMGKRYKFLAFFPKESANLFHNDPPAGFDSGNELN